MMDIQVPSTAMRPAKTLVFLKPSLDRAPNCQTRELQTPYVNNAGGVGDEVSFHGN